MAKLYKVRIAKSVGKDIEELAAYISGTLMMPAVASEYVNKLLDRIRSLQEFPDRILLTKEEPWRSRGFRQMAAYNHIVYFWIDEENAVVHVTKVIYARSDQRKALEKE